MTHGKVAFITGGGSGIGAAAAGAFVARGYATVIVDMDEDGGRAVEEELGAIGECRFLRCDVTDDENVKATIQDAVARYGRLDAAFNAAGIDGEHGKLTAEGSTENWNRVLAVDLSGLWSCMRYEIPELLKTGGGVIVNCASVAGLRAAPTVSAYTAAKHGVVGLTKVAAREYASRGVRVNAVCPGSVDTPMFRRSMPPEFIERVIANIPAGRLAEADEIASVVLWLCDDAPGFLTGQMIAIDGGTSA